MIMTALKKMFDSFLHRFQILHHFRRLFLLESVEQSGVSREAPPELMQNLQKASQLDIDLLLSNLGTSRDGLTHDQAVSIREKTGFNEVHHAKPMPWWEKLWLSYRNPFNVLLTVLALISLLTGDAAAAIIITLMVTLSTLLRFWQEEKANREAEALKELVHNKANVLRQTALEDGSTGPAQESGRLVPRGVQHGKVKEVELPIRNLVPGDIVLFSAGDMIPADCRTIMAKDLFVNQSAMTGESMPVEKFVDHHNQSQSNLMDLDNILFMGTNVISGSAMAVVLSTGNNTYFGTLADRVTAVDPAPTSFQSGVNSVSWMLIRMMLIMAPLVLFINGFTKHNWLDASLFALSIAVGLTPEMLPMIVTATLAKGAVFLSKQKVIVKRLDAIQNFGAMDIFCTDKTGTLTQDKIVLSNHLDAWGEESDDVLEMAYLNSYYQTGLKNLLDVAVLERVEVHQELNPAGNFAMIDEIPFDFTRRRMSVVVKPNDQDTHTIITKGAVEEILAVCGKVRHDGKDEDLNEDHMNRIREVTDQLNLDGLRVIAVAIKDTPITQETYSVKDESGLTLIGYVAFLDPPKDSSATAIAKLHDMGVSVKVLTGDNKLVAGKVCRDVGIDVATEDILEGSDIEGMTDEELAPLARERKVFAKLIPTHKARIVRLLKEKGHTVGFMGDGINDAPALRAADIGISVDTGVDIAKAAADIILLEKSLLVLEEGVEEGRRTFVNMLKYIKMTASSNFGNVISVLVASVFIPFLPMTPLQLLTQNLLYDVSQTAIPFDNVDKEQIRVPLKWNPSDLFKFMLFFGPISSLFDIVTFGMMWYVFAANSIPKQSLFQSGWFIVGIITQTLVVHMIRTAKLPFLQSMSSSSLIALTLGIVAIGIFLPMGPLAGYFGMQHLPPLYFVLLPFIVAAYMALTQMMKRIYIKKYGWH